MIGLTLGELFALSDVGSKIVRFSIDRCLARSRWHTASKPLVGSRSSKLLWDSESADAHLQHLERSRSRTLSESMGCVTRSA